MLMICRLVLSPSPERLQKSINVIKKHAEEWKLKVNAKKSNIIIFSGNGQTKNNENFQYAGFRNITYRRQAKKHAEEWKLKVNTKKSNIIIFSGNGQTKNNDNFQYAGVQKHYLSSTNKHIWG